MRKRGGSSEAYYYIKAVHFEYYKLYELVLSQVNSVPMSYYTYFGIRVFEPKPEGSRRCVALLHGEVRT